MDNVWGSLWPGRAALCQDLGVLNALKVLGAREKPGRLDVVGAGATSFADLVG